MANLTTESAPLYVAKITPGQHAAPFGNEVTSYFDIAPRRDKPVFAREQVSPADISPEARLRPDQMTTARRPYFRFHSDYEALHRRIHGFTIDEQQSHESFTSPDTCSPPSRASPSSKSNPGRSFERKIRHSSIHSSESSAQSSPVYGSRSSRTGHPYSQRRTKISQIWGRSPSVVSGLDMRSGAGDRRHRQSSTVSESVASGGHIIIVRTSQTPLKPPQATSGPVTRKSKASAIKIETEFTEPGSANGISRPIETLGHRAAQAPKHRRGSSSGKSSINVKQLFSAPLYVLRRMSAAKHSKPSTSAAGHRLSPPRRSARLPDHTTQLKRNHTAEALQRVTATLQEIKQPSPVSRFHPPIARPSTWKSLSEMAVPTKMKRGPKTTQGITSGLAHQGLAGSGERTFGISRLQSYSSSVRGLRMGGVPTNTPNESATYKIKRSPSAETEEFLKVDISIRGGTSYLPSEARRIHTPPLPEEGVDGRWKGFFFDYNAPRRTSELAAPEVVVRGVTDSGTVSPGSAVSSEVTPDSKHKLERTKTKNRRIVTGDWVDVKLAEIDMLENEVDEIDIKSSNRRLNTMDVLSKHQSEIMSETKEVAPEVFDLTIPEHLSNSPLCPRHPRYWRVVKGKGSQFRGCWMHGLGLYEDRP